MYKTAATLLWMVVAALLAFNVAVVYDLPPRQLVFALALASGVVLLISINWGGTTWRQATTLPRQLESGEPALLNAGEKKKDQKEPRVTTPDSSEKLTPDQAREWLDNFLIKQQK